MGERKNFKGANNTIMVKDANGKIVDNIAGAKLPSTNPLILMAPPAGVSTLDHQFFMACMDLALNEAAEDPEMIEILLGKDFGLYQDRLMMMCREEMSAADKNGRNILKTNPAVADAFIEEIYNELRR